MHFCVLVVFLIINSASSAQARTAMRISSQNEPGSLVLKTSNSRSDPNVNKVPPQPTPVPLISNNGTNGKNTTSAKGLTPNSRSVPNVNKVPPQPTPVTLISNNGTNGTNTTSAKGLTPSDWIYIGIAIALSVIICQSICFYLYIRKLKSSQTARNVPLITADANSEDRYQREPTRSNANTPRPAEHDHSSSLYEYECIKEKPKPPPISTLPKRERPPLPLPHNIQGLKSSTLTPHSTQECLQQRGREVSTVPSKPPMNFNAAAQLPSRSPQQRRLPTPVRTPVLKQRGTTREDRSSYKIYESLPDLRDFRHQAKLPNVHQPLVVVNPPSATTSTQNLNRIRRMPAHHSNLSINTPAPALPPKPRGPLAQEHNRNGFPTKPREIIKNGSSHFIYESLPDLREFKHYQKTSIAPPPVFAPAHPISSSLNRPRVPVTGPDSITSELMNKLKRRAELSSLSTSQNTRSPALPRKLPVMPPPDVTQIDSDDSTDDEEWTIEEIKKINMYNI